MERIETILEDIVAKQLGGLADDVKAIKADLDADKANLARLENTGKGLLVGVGIFATAIGASASSFWQWLVGVAH